MDVKDATNARSWDEGTSNSIIMRIKEGNSKNADITYKNRCVSD